MLCQCYAQLYLTSFELSTCSFFAILLSPILDGFDQLLSFNALSFCCQLTRQHQEERDKNLSLKKSWKRWESNPGRAAGVRSLSATAVLWRPPITINFFSWSRGWGCHFHFRSTWLMAIMDQIISWLLIRTMYQWLDPQKADFETHASWNKSF